MNMAGNNQGFTIQTFDWDGSYGINNVTNEMKSTGEKLAKCLVYGIKKFKYLEKHEKKSPLNVEEFSSQENTQDNIAVGGDFRIDLQNKIDGTYFKVAEGFSKKDEFARYEIQKNEPNTGRTSIANVCIPLKTVMTGTVVVNAFVTSMNSQRMAVIRKN